jgi:hypothetical protein
VDPKQFLKESLTSRVRCLLVNHRLFQNLVNYFHNYFLPEIPKGLI